MNGGQGEAAMFFSRIKRPVAGTVLIAFIAGVLQPLSVLAQERPQSTAERQIVESGEDRYARLLNEIHGILKEVAPRAAISHLPPATGEKQLRAIGPNMMIEVQPAKPAARVDVAAKVSELRRKVKDLASLEPQVRAGFDETAKHVRDKQLPPEILARHEEAIRAYEARAAQFNALVDGIERASADGVSLQRALDDLAAFMAKYPNQKTHTPTDPNKLPWGSPSGVTRAPFTLPSQFRTSHLFGQPVRVAQAGSLSGISLPTAILPATPVPADTAPTEDVQITPAIRQLATSLNNNPVQIYNWVRNNIQFIPSYGSIQGSDLTLQTRRGNSFDTASLLIALLRAGNIPARYVYGTIEVPADKVMNWVGGVSVPQAAINLMGQGGIPVIGVAQGGQVRLVRLEHVWVEAFVDFVPSRGAVNRSPNTWVPLDASFKQYAYTQGLDFRANVSLDVPSLIAQLQQGGTINQPEMSVQNPNQAAVREALLDYQARATAYLNEQRPNPTVKDVLGSQTIVQENRSILLGTLPYNRIATGARLQELPDSLRTKVQYSLYASDFDRAMDIPVFQFVQSLPRLSGKKITLSFAAATQADADLMESYLPPAHADGTPNELSEFPKTLPGYLIRVTPELRVDGALVAKGGSFTMGTELISSIGLYEPSEGWNFGEDNRPIAGEYIATHVDYQGVSPTQMQAIRGRLGTTKALLENHHLDGLTKEEMTGDVLYAAVLAYFVNNQAVSEISARATGIVEYRKPSFGSFQASAQPQFWFGIPRNVAFRSVTMDVDRYTTMSVAKDNSASALLAYRQQAGMRLSAYEHAIPEQLFSEPGSTVQAVSAAKALAVAAAQGQRIYTITSDNADLVLPQLTISAEVKSEIANAVLAGRWAVVSQAPVSVGAWSGVGYIISDPQTGAGAYKISGGTNGGELPWNVIGAALGAMLDALLKHYRSPDSMFGPLGEIAFARFAKAAADALSVLALVVDILRTLADPNLNTAQKVVKIAGAGISAILGSWIGGAIGALLLNPIAAVVVAVILVVIVTILIDLLVNWIVGELAYYWKFRRRYVLARYA